MLMLPSVELTLFAAHPKAQEKEAQQISRELITASFVRMNCIRATGPPLYVMRSILGIDE